jgi:hypothetical protein
LSNSKHGVRNFTMTDVQPNGMIKIGYGADGEFVTAEVDKDLAIMILAAFEGGKEWMREELRLLLNVPEKTWRTS